MSDRFWTTLALSLAAFVSTAITPSAYAGSPPRVEIKTTPAPDRCPPNHGGDNTTYVVIVVVISPSGDTYEIRCPGRTEEQARALAKTVIAEQQTRGNKATRK